MTPDSGHEIDADEISSVLAEGIHCGGEWAEVFIERRDSETVPSSW